jgi:hypothetical protein
MSGMTCANHPNETTFVRCGRCEKPICVRCMVDTPVGKKCRDCARNRTHLSESTPGQVALAFVAATCVAIPAGWVMHFIPIIFLGAAIYGALVGEVTLRAGRRRRSVAMQVAAGLAAFIGGVLGSPFFWFALQLARHPGGGVALAHFASFSLVYGLASTAIGVAIAVSRVRFL